MPYFTPQPYGAVDDVVSSSPPNSFVTPSGKETMTMYYADNYEAAYAKGAPTPVESARDQAVEQSAAEAPAPRKSAVPSKAAVAASAACSRSAADSMR